MIKSPHSIVIKNKYYRSGLTKGMVIDHYIKNKDLIIKELNGNFILMFIFVDKNKYTIKRKWYGKQITLKTGNYKNIINGRSVAISMEHKKMVDRIVIDIDSKGDNSEIEKKKAVELVIGYFESRYKYDIKKIRVFNSSDCYHVHGYLKSSINYKKALSETEFDLSAAFNGIYNVNKKKNFTKKFNLDLHYHYNRGSITIPHSICRNGLISLDLTKTWESYNRKQSIIKGT